MQLTHLSASRIKTYEQCPLKYHAVYDLKLPEPPEHPLTTMGSACHETYEDGVKALLAGEEFDWPTRTRFKCRDLEVDADLWDLAAQLVQNGLDWGVLRNIRHTVKCEMECNIVLPDGTKVTGFIDRLDINKAKADIIDYKTQKREFDDALLPQDWQARIYNIAVRQEFPEVKDVTVSFWVLRHRVQRVIKTARDAENDIAALMAMGKEIRECEDPKGCPSGLCPWCPYHKDCPAKKQGIKARFKRGK
jgi:RecB family exonuclease